ncbi:MAG: hypothetical protein PVG25_04365 [Anaerolineae bacterium]|jgi:hypothetical protein
MRPIFTTQARREPALCSLQFVGSALIIVGFLGPWVAHKTAALTVTGYELSEFAKFFPQVQGGVVPVRRGLFVAPLLAASISLALVFQRSRTPSLLRVAAIALAILLGLLAFPPYQSFLEPVYRLQLILVAAGLSLVLLTPLARQLSERIRGWLFLILALSAAGAALWQAVLLWPLVVQLYGAPVWPGWGAFVCAIGLLLLLFVSLHDLLRS